MELLQYYAMERFLYRLTEFCKKSKLQTCPESFSGLLDELFAFLLPLAKEIETKNSIRGQWTLESGWKTQD